MTGNHDDKATSENLDDILSLVRDPRFSRVLGRAILVGLGLLFTYGFTFGAGWLNHALVQTPTEVKGIKLNMDKWEKGEKYKLEKLELLNKQMTANTFAIERLDQQFTITNQTLKSILEAELRQ
jgi:hypothetical protein